jgi:hypothetical protein
MNSIITAIETNLPLSEVWSNHKDSLEKAQSLVELVYATLGIVWFLARSILQAELNQRGSQPREKPACQCCGRALQSKGLHSRQIHTLFGTIEWKRRVLRCGHGCHDSQRIPSDEALGIAPYEQTSWEVKRLGCLLSIFVPYELAHHLLEQLSGISISESSLWNWVQAAGERAKQLWQERLAAMAAGETVSRESLSQELEQLTLAIGADGVTVPFRPQAGSARGKTKYQEVKIAIIARLQPLKNAAGKVYTRLCQRRLVAVLGNIDQFKPRLLWEALHQGLQQAPQVVWLSDGGVGFWRVYRECFAHCAVGILDFYHAAAHLWKAAKAWLGADMEAAQVAFERWRHCLRHGKHHQVLRELTQLVNTLKLQKEQQEEFAQVQAYFQEHWEHLSYQKFEQQGLPLGSGMVESACKWLIQQRFKGVGMRWSEAGFENLLYLRLAWVNQRFDELFPPVCLFSPNP